MHKNRTILASKSMDFRFSKIHFKPSKECEKQQNQKNGNEKRTHDNSAECHTNVLYVMPNYILEDKIQTNKISQFGLAARY